MFRRVRFAFLNFRSVVLAGFGLMAAPLGIGCESPDPDLTPLEAGADAAATGGDAVTAEAADAADAAPTCPEIEALTPLPGDASCRPRPGDYTPGAADAWPACISDDGVYHPFNTSISSVARVDAFERIAALLRFGGSKLPTPAEFIEAKAIFAEDQGLGSRVERREDEHYPAAPAACNTLTPEQLAVYPERCVGPARLLPLVNAAFADGVAGKEPRENVARLEAALLWFMYLSPHKEARTCLSKVDDCDSSWAYYTGGDAPSAGKGFARYVRARSPDTHAAIWNGVLAVRCWRDLDNPTGAATNVTLRDQAVAQLDRGLARGLAVIVRQRVTDRLCHGSWAGTRILGAALDREAAARDPSKAAALRAELAKTDPTTVDEKAALAAIDALFPCAY